MKTLNQVVGNLIISSSIVLGMFSQGAMASENKDRSRITYLCTASYLYRHIEVVSIPDMSDENSVVDIISTFSADFSGSTAAGGGSIMEGRSVVEKDPEDGELGIYINENKLTNREGDTLEAIGIYSNGEKGKFDFSVQFFNDKTSKPAGKELKFKGSGVKITEVLPNEFIQVSCSLVKRIVVNN